VAEGVLVSNSDGLGYWICQEAPVRQKRQQQGPVQMRQPSYGGGIRQGGYGR
jgi:hypothetical protein